jgi:LacI family transcriptional regulator
MVPWWPRAVRVTAPALSRLQGFDHGADPVGERHRLDMMALGCYDAIRAAGLRCPTDVSVVGYNDMPLTHRVDPPLTTVRVPYFDLGRQAASLLVEALDDRSSMDRSVRLTPRLRVRDSTAHAPA